MPVKTSIFDYFPSISLTADQRTALEAFDSFLSSEAEQVFILRGYAGTGKTTLAGGLVSYLKSLGINSLCMAPTGSAAHVLSYKTGVAARTIHSTIYKQRVLDFTADNDFVVHYDVSTQCPKEGSVLFIDEASMISKYVDTENPQMKFGSGDLLYDLFEFAKYQTNRKTKLVFVGDSAQLPPVKSNFSPALDGSFLKNNYGIGCREVLLSQIVRFDNDILNTATRMRESIEKDMFHDYKPIAGGMVKIVGSYELNSTYWEQVHSLADAKDCVALFYGNSSAVKFNEAVRNILVPGAISITAGERLLVNANNYAADVLLFNGEIIDVIAVEEKETRIMTIKISKDKDVPDVPFVRRIDATSVEVMLCFRDILIRKADGQVFSVKLLEDLLTYPSNETPKILRQALVIDLKNRVRDKMGGEYTTAALGTAYFNDPYFNALRAKYAYGMTCHKAQGNEWKTVFVNTWTPPDSYIKNRYRWLYTAYTRASERLVAECSQTAKDFADHHVPEEDTQTTVSGGKTTDPRTETIKADLKAFGLDLDNIDPKLADRLLDILKKK